MCLDRTGRIVVADDQTIMREGLRELLSANGDFEVVGEANNGRDAIRCVNNLKPDLILMGLSMQGMSGLAAITEINRQASETKILV
jgi:DNA-binding NarL/FixJ family response regulator